jgi:hypothetical protein
MSYCILFNTGGTAHPIWNKSVAMSYTEAQIALIIVQRMGYDAKLENYLNAKVPE